MLAPLPNSFWTSDLMAGLISVSSSREVRRPFEESVFAVAVVPGNTRSVGAPAFTHDQQPREEPCQVLPFLCTPPFLPEDDSCQSTHQGFHPWASTMKPHTIRLSCRIVWPGLRGRFRLGGYGQDQLKVSSNLAYVERPFEPADHGLRAGGKQTGRERRQARVRRTALAERGRNSTVPRYQTLCRSSQSVAAGGCGSRTRCD